MNACSMKLVAVAAAATFFAGGAVAGENLLKYGDAEDAAWAPKWNKSLTLNPEQKMHGKNSFEAAKKNTWCYSPTMVAVDPAKAYEVSACLKSLGGKNGRCYVGLCMYDKNKRAIGRTAVTVNPKSFTELMADVKPGTKALKVSDCAKWNKTKNRTVVAFGAKADYSDLPNRDISFPVVKVEKKDGFYEVTLRAPLKKAYSAGTMIRQHYLGGGWQYCAASNKEAPKKWTQYKAVVTGMPKYGAPNNQFWPGTKFVRVVVIANYGGKATTKTVFDDVVLKEVPVPKKKK